MQHVVVTGARGFIGRNLMIALRRREDVDAVGFDLGDSSEDLSRALALADVVYHLAGVNRSEDPEGFESGNAGLTAEICGMLTAAGSRPKLVFASSIQAELDNPYGASKRRAESILTKWCEDGGGSAEVFRLPNVFGKWGRPNYNSAVSTFCHNIAHGLPLRVDDPEAVVTLAYIDDVVDAFIAALNADSHGVAWGTVSPAADITVGELAALIRSMGESVATVDLPDLSSGFARALFATFISYLEPDDLTFAFQMRRDERGALAELMRAPAAGQVFVSHTHPGITRGDHYHDSKVERFMVVWGEGLVRLRRLDRRDVDEYAVSGSSPSAVIIPPGTAHSIENVGSTEMVTLFWASEVFDPDRPDVYHERVLPEGEHQ